jgi:hemerythrin superfamily protein
VNKEEEIRAEREAKRRERRLNDLLHIMKSKTVLSFGYKSFLNYYYKMSCFKTMQCFGWFCCCKCFKVNKHSSMTARKYKRQVNGQKKINSEFDIIEIVKTLRHARFLIDNAMTEKQKKLIDFFKCYSLETPYIKKEQNFNKLDLFKTFIDPKNEENKNQMND